MFSLSDLFVFLHQAEPHVLRLIKDEIIRDLDRRTVCSSQREEPVADQVFDRTNK